MEDSPLKRKFISPQHEGTTFVTQRKKIKINKNEGLGKEEGVGF